MKRLSRILIATLLTTAFAITSCSVDYETGKHNDTFTGETAEITFLADLPSATPITTRAVGTVSENKINDLFVLVFDKTTQDLIYKSGRITPAAASGSTNDNTVTFKATLPVGTEYNFMVLTNTGSLLNEMHVGVTPAKKKSEVMDLTLTKTKGENWDISTESIPMWGELTTTLTTSSSPTFELTRMMARVNVNVDLRDVGGVPRDNFKLTSVRYYNYNTGGAIVPDDENLDIRTTPTIPSSITPETGDYLLYDASYIEDGKSCDKKIYVFEAAHNGKTYNLPDGNSDWIDNPCLVIGGQYTTEDGKTLNETFYRVDFIRKDKTDPNDVKDIWLSVLRNFSYNVAIVEVNGAGYDEPEVALKSAPINMEANVLEWDERDMGEIVFDGVFYLSVSRDEFTFERGKIEDKRDEYILYVKTDYIYNHDASDSRSGWYVEKYVDGTDGETPVTWLTLNPGKGMPDQITEAYFTFEENPENTNRTAIVWIAAGRLRYPVYITQRVLSLYITDPDDNDNPVSEMMFVVPVPGTNHPERKFDVTWTPVDFEVDITMESPEVWNPFEPGWLNPNPDLLGKIPANSGGTQRFTITPPTVDQSAIDQDPFYQKETTFSFTVNNGSDEETKSITLHQIYYNILVDTYNYRLDGKTYTISVRSNTDWVITDIEEWLYNKEPDPTNPYPYPILLDLKNYDNLKVGTTGGPNISGESLAFTVVNEDYAAHKNKFGTVYVTFANPDNKFETLRVAISFPPQKMTVMGLGYGDTDGGWNVCAPTSRHRGCIYYMYNSEKNFGFLEESKVKVRDLNLVGFHAEGVAASAQGLWNEERLREWINVYQPDIIFLTYSINLNTAASKLLVEYMKNGGTVVAFIGGYNDNPGYYVRYFFNEVFEKNLVNTSAGWNMGIGSSGDVFAFPTTTEWADHPLIKGPFGDLNGKLWGSHGATTGFVPPDDVLAKITPLNSYADCVYSGGNASRVVSFVHNEYKLFWCGNDAFMGSYYPELQAGTASNFWPCQLDSDWNPIACENHGRVGATIAKYTVDNSTFMGNLMAWAISNADYKHPVGGYQ